MDLQIRFETERLIIQKPKIKDAEKIFQAYAQDFEVTKYLTWLTHKSIDTTKTFLDQCIIQWGMNGRFPFTISLKNPETLIGMLEARVENFKADLGYVLSKEYWKRGLMAEALSPVVDELLRQESIARVWAFCDLENYGSRRVLEKIGMECEGKLRRWVVLPNISGFPRDCFVFSKVK